MSWVKLSDDMPSHPKIVGLSDAAFRSFITGTCYCAHYLTDGLIPAKAVPTIASAKAKRELVDANLWCETAAGIVVNDFLDYNLSRAKVEEERAKTAARVKDWRHRNGERNAVTSPVSNDVSNAAPVPEPEPVPEGDDLEANAVGVGNGSATFQSPALTARDRLVDALQNADATSETLKRIETLHRKHQFAEGDWVEALEAATSRTARSPSAVAIRILQQRGQKHEDARQRIAASLNGTVV